MMRESLLVFVIACSLSVVFASRNCYSCNSYTDQDHKACLQPMSSSVKHIVCSDSYLCTRVSYKFDNQNVVARGCNSGGVDTCMNIYNTISSYSEITGFTCYPCSEDYCNDDYGFYYASESRDIEHIDGNVTSADEKIKANIL